MKGHPCQPSKSHCRFTPAVFLGGYEVRSSAIMLAGGNLLRLKLSPVLLRPLRSAPPIHPRKVSPGSGWRISPSQCRPPSQISGRYWSRNRSTLRSTSVL